LEVESLQALEYLYLNNNQLCGDLPDFDESVELDVDALPTCVPTPIPTPSPTLNPTSSPTPNDLECSVIQRGYSDIHVRELLCKSSSKNCNWKVNKGRCKVQKTKTRCKHMDEDKCVAKKHCVPIMKNGVFKRCCNKKHGLKCNSE